MREFLRQLKLDKQTEDAIMAEYGKKISDYRKVINGYRESEKTYKTQIEELNSTVESNKKELENLQTMTTENNDLKAQLQMSGQNVKKEFSKFVKNEVLSMVDENTDFESALNTYKKENPQYFGDPVVVKTQTSPTLSSENQPQTTNNIMNDIIRNSV